MTKLLSTPIIIQSGEKYKTAEGFSAIRDGIKKSVQETGHGGNAAPYLRKPPWLRVTYNSSPKYQAVQDIVREHRLSTVCEEAKCPNMSECWSHGTATVMLMGYVCTRACRFCSVDTGNPNGWLDREEPINTAKSVQLMGLKYVVLTSVDRDDLADGGANHYADTIINIKKLSNETKVEALTGDFQGNLKDVQTVLDSGVDVFAQNVETVRRLTHPVRDPRASYEQTLAVLAFAKRYRQDVITKTSLMLGLGETEAEIIETMDDLLAIGVDVVTFGQYLQPTKNHLPIERYVTPEEFERYRKIGLEKGFFEVASGALVRSSYRADRIFEKNNLGMTDGSAE